MTWRRAGIPALLAAAALGGITIVAMLWYVMHSDSPHTAFDPYGTFAIFLPLGMAAAAAFKTNRKASAVALTVAIFGIALVVVLDQTNRLVQYDRWVNRGMP